jgi:hypothetical protein
MRHGVARLGGLILLGIFMAVGTDDAAPQGTRGGFPSEAVEAQNIDAVRRKLLDVQFGLDWFLADCMYALDQLATLESEVKTHPGITPQRRAELITEIRRFASRLQRTTCQKPAAAPGTPIVAFDLSAGGQTIKLPKRSFLGFEPLGAPAPTLGLVQPSRDASGPSGQFEIKINTGVLPSLRFSLGHSEGDMGQFFPVIDPGAGNRIVLPGPLGGASGVSAGGHPLNIVRDTHYQYEFRETTIGVILGGGVNDWGFTYAEALRVAPYFGVEYARSATNEQFAGSIPGLGRDFAYMTNVDVDRVGVRVGVEGEIPVNNFFDNGSLSHELRFGRGYRVEPRDDHWDIALRFAGEFSGFRLSASGQDHFTFTGVPSSSAPLDTTATKFGYGLRGGVEWRNPTGLVFGVMTGYERAPGYGAVERDGNNPSRYVFKSADVFKVTGVVKFTLGGK